jgi:hypothetical protein
MKKTLLLLAFSLLLFVNVNAQHGDFDLDFNDLWGFERPVIEASYGLSKTYLSGFTNSFENTSLIDLKLGYSSEISKHTKKWRKRYSGNTYNKYHFGYLTVGAYSSDIDFRDKTAGSLPLSMWRFGLGKKEGYPIKAGSVSILPFNSNTLMWSRLDMKQFPDSSNMTDLSTILMYNQTFRFGSTFEGGVDVHFTNMLSVSLQYERSNIYQRYLFWKGAGSMVIEEIGSGMIDYFVKQILRNKPVAGSIVNFVLKNAYYYGFYQLRTQEMNWPFGGEPALNFNTFKLGFGFTF